MLPRGNWWEPRPARDLVFAQQACGCEPVGNARESEPHVLRDRRGTSAISHQCVKSLRQYLWLSETAVLPGGLGAGNQKQQQHVAVRIPAGPCWVRTLRRQMDYSSI